MAGPSLKSIFIDASVLFTACKSRFGASALILAYCKREKIKGYISLYAITEVKRNITYETDQKVKRRLNMFLLGSKLKLVEPAEPEIERCKKVINEKDAPILAAALMAKADVLTTLDKKDFFQPKVREFMHPTKILSPKDLLNSLSP